MAEKRAKSCSATEEPELDDHLVDIIRMSSSGEQRMGSLKRAEFRLEIVERS